MALSGRRPAAVADGVPAFHRVGGAGVTGEVPAHAAGQGPGCSRRQPEPRTGDHRLPGAKGTDTVGRDGRRAGKKINGRKRFIITDTLTATVVAARLQDRDGAKISLLSAYILTPIRHVFAGQGFTGRLVDWVRGTLRPRWGSPASPPTSAASPPTPTAGS